MKALSCFDRWPFVTLKKDSLYALFCMEHRQQVMKICGSLFKGQLVIDYWHDLRF